MHTVKAPDAEPIPGYRLVEPLGKGGFGEVWKCVAPGGLLKAIKFVIGPDDLADPRAAGVEQELRALHHIRSIRHPFLLSIERAEVIDGELVIVMELADRSLHELFAECRDAGQPGIPRPELLAYLTEAAEALDVLGQEHGLQHLDVKPHNLFLVGRHVKLADFGLVNSLAELRSPSGLAKPSESFTPLYAAPETFLGQFTLFSDQYSLAITYQELLTGTLPLTGRNYRQLALRHVQGEPDLEPLPEADRPIVARALAKTPSQRYQSCTAFVEALRARPNVPPPHVVRAHGTMHDVRPGDLGATPVEPRADSSATPPSVIRQQPSAAAFLAGYRLLECVSRQPAAEVWKAQTSDGHKRLVKLLNGYDHREERPGGDALARLRGLRHEALPSLEIQLGQPVGLALITDAPDGTLADRLRECQQMGLSGIPRPELLGHLRRAAEALDALYQQHRLQHLTLAPRQLALWASRLCLLDFALAELLWLPAGQGPAALNTRYAAPELFERQISRHCDQYSLALIYQELLTGIHAFRNLNPRQMAVARLRGRPDLGLLPAPDRPLVLQALDIDPERRFPTCTAFVDALEGVSAERGIASASRPTRGQGVTLPVSLPPSGTLPPGGGRQVSCPPPFVPDRPVAEMKQIIAEEVVAAAGGWEVRTFGSLRYRFRTAGSSGVVPGLAHFACGRFVPGTLDLKLHDFKREWQAQRMEAEGSPALPDGRSALHHTPGLLYQVRLPPSLWQRCLGRSPVLVVQIDLVAPQTTTECLTEVLVRIRALDCSPEQGAEHLAAVGLQLLLSVRNHLQLSPERRGAERFAYPENVGLSPRLTAQEMGEAFVAQGRDISLGGLGLWLPCLPPSDRLLVHLTPTRRAPLAVPGQVMHTQLCGDGRYLVGLRFAWEMLSLPGG